MKAFNYTPQEFGRSLVNFRREIDLKSKIPTSIMLMCTAEVRGGVQNPFFARILAGMEQESFHNGIHTIFFVERKGAKGLSFLKKDAFLGVVVEERVDPKCLKFFDQNKIPYTFVSGLQPHSDCVTSNYKSGIQQILKYLFRLGHTRIGFLGRPKNISSATEKWKAFEDTMTAAGLPVNPHWVKFGDYEFEAGHQMANEILKSKNLPTALVCGNDMVAMGAIMAARERGLQVPGDISVTGFDDNDVRNLMRPSIELTTVRIDAEEVGAEAVRTILSVKNRTPGKIVRTVLPTKLIVRSSCKPQKR